MKRKLKNINKAKTKLQQVNNYDSVLDPDQLKSGRVEGLSVYEESYKQNKW